MPNLSEFSRSPFFCHSFSWALLQANSCVRQLRGFCFPGSSRDTMGPSHKAAARFGSRALASGCPRKMGQKKETFSCPTYMLSGIAFEAVLAVESLEHASGLAGHSRNEGLRRRRRRV